MQPDVKRDFQWGRQFIPHLREIAGSALITEAPPEEDKNHNTDLIVLRLAAIRIGCRVRRLSFIKRYSNQFTIRSKRDSGAKTELAKIVTDGWGDYFIYGFGNDQTHRLEGWLVGDLRVFRDWFTCRVKAGVTPGRLVRNPDGTWFRAFDIDEPPAEFLIAHLPVVHDATHGAPTDEPPPPQPADIDPDAAVKFGHNDHPDTFKLPTDQQSREYARTGAFTPDPNGWTQ